MPQWYFGRWTCGLRPWLPLECCDHPGCLGGIAKYCNDKAKIRYFPSWAEDVFTDAGVQLALEVPEWADGFTVLFAGNIGEAQDMPAVLDAAERLKDNASIRWIIVGDGRKSEWLRSEVAQRGLCYVPE